MTTGVIEQLVAAMNRHDLDGVAALIHPGYRSEQPAHPSFAFVGRAQMLANWEAMFGGIPDFTAELRRSVVADGTEWCEWHWFGTRTDGSPFEMRGVTLFETSGGQIVAGRLYLEEVDGDDITIGRVVEDLSGRRPRIGPDAD